MQLGICMAYFVCNLGCWFSCLTMIASGSYRGARFTTGVHGALEVNGPILIYIWFTYWFTFKDLAQCLEISFFFGKFIATKLRTVYELVQNEWIWSNWSTEESLSKQPLRWVQVQAQDTILITRPEAGTDCCRKVHTGFSRSGVRVRPCSSLVVRKVQVKWIEVVSKVLFS